MINTEESPKIDSFCELLHSHNHDDCIRYHLFVQILDQVFGQHDQILIEPSHETASNHQYIIDKWPALTYYFQIPIKVRSQERCVRQTIKYIVTFLNKRYQWVCPIQFQYVKKTFRDGDRTYGKSFTVLSFVKT